MVEIFHNIRKIYDFAQPCEELAAHVEFFAESSIERTKQYFPNENFTVKMFASWTPTFYINMGVPYYISLENRRYLIKTDEDILILRNSTVERYNQPADNIFTVKFYPGGLEAILGISQILAIDQIINLRQLLPGSLLDALKKPISFEGRIQLVEQFLLKAYRAKTYKDHYVTIVNDAIGEFEGGSMQLNTSAVAERLFISSKTINRYFHRVVGMPPKSYFSILRARTALSAFVSGQKTFIPFDFGYYDMSHFYKDVKKFTGQNLTEHEL